MRTPSLRRRAVLWSVGVLALLLAIVGFGVDLALGSVLRAEQETRLKSVASLATQLTGLSDQDLADQLSIPGIRAEIAYAGGEEPVTGVPQAPPGGDRRRGPVPVPRAAAAAETEPVITRDGNRVVATQALRAGVTVVLTADNGPIEQALARFRLIMAIASVAAVALAALLLPLVLGRALRPLTALTDAARQTAAGGRGRRLDPRDPDTDLGRAATQFDAMLEELEGAERRAGAAADRLARFLSDASHELRTPLAGISAGAERLIREPLDDEARDRVTVQVVREARRSARLVDDLLLVSRLGELRVEVRPIGLRPVLADAADRVRSRPEAPVVEVRADDLRVLADRERTDQVLANLLVNAVNAGASHLRITATAEGEQAVIRVADDGRGVPLPAREAVFERLVRLDAARSKGTGGAGLGLPIARGLAEAQGGSLDCVAPAEHDLGGAVLVLRLPLAMPVPASPAVELDAVAGERRGSISGAEPASLTPSTRPTRATPLPSWSRGRVR